MLATLGAKQMVLKRKEHNLESVTDIFDFLHIYVCVCEYMSVCLWSIQWACF